MEQGRENIFDLLKLFSKVKRAAKKSEKER